MASLEIEDKNLTQNQFNVMTKPMALDLIAFFNIAEEAIIKEVKKAEDEGLTPNQLLTNIQDIL